MLIANSMGLCMARPQRRELMGRMAEAGYDAVDFSFFDAPEALDWSDAAAAETWLDGLAADAGAARLQPAHGA